MIQLYLILPVIIIFCVIFGIRRGLFLEIVSFWNLFISFVLTFTFFENLSFFLINSFSLILGQYDEMVIKTISFVALFVVFLVVSIILSNILFGKLKIRLISVVDKLGAAFLGIIKGFIISSLILIILAMLPTTGYILQKENLDTTRRIYLIAPKFYEYLLDTLSSNSEFDNQVFLDTYANFLSLKEETGSENTQDNIN